LRISPPHERAAYKSFLKDVPAPVFGKVTPRVVVQMPIRAEYSRTWRRITASLYEDIHRGTPALGEALRRQDCARQYSRILFLLGRVRRWLHLQMVSHATAGLVSHALHPMGAPFLSPFITGVSAPRRASCALQLLDEKALRASPGRWHRFCLFLEGRP
jgi:hypothetical protein